MLDRIAVVLLLAFLPALSRAEPAMEAWIAAVNNGNVDAVRRATISDVNAPDEFGRRALTIASWQGNLAMVKALVDRGADVNLKEAESGYVKVPTPNGRKDYSLSGRSPLAVAMQYRHSEVARYLISKGADLTSEDSRGFNMLWAVCDGDIAQKLLRAGLDPNKGPSKPQPFDYVAVSKPIWNAVTCADAAVTKIFLDAGADPNHLRGGGDSPLHIATRHHGAPETIEALIEAGAKVDAPNADGETPLMFAAQFHESPEVIRILLKHGADPNATDRLGKNALQRVGGGNVGLKRKLLEAAVAAR